MLRLPRNKFLLLALIGTVIAFPQTQDTADDSDHANDDATCAKQAAPADYHSSSRDTWSLNEWIVTGTHRVYSTRQSGNRVSLDVVFEANATLDSQPVPHYKWVNGTDAEGNVTIAQIKEDIEKDPQIQAEWKSSLAADFNDLIVQGVNLTDKACAWDDINIGRHLSQEAFTGRWTMVILGLGTGGLLYSIDQLAKSTIPAVAPGEAPAELSDDVKTVAAIATLVVLFSNWALLMLNARNGNLARVDRFVYTILRIVLIELLVFVAGRVDAQGQRVPPNDVDIQAGLGEIAAGLVRHSLNAIGFDNRQIVVAQITRAGLTCGA